MDVKDLTMKINMCVALILSECSLAIAQSETFQVVEPGKIPGILRTIATQTKANFEQIHTWQGELEASRYFVDRGEKAKRTFETMTDAIGLCPNEIIELDSSRIIFKCDLDKGMFHSKSCREFPSRYIDPANNRDLGTKSLPKCSSQIITKEYRYISEPLVRNKNGEVIQRKAIKEKADTDSPGYKGLQPVYLPKYVFDIDSQVWERYPDFVNIIEEKGEYVFDGLALKVEQQTLSGDVQYRVHEPFTLNAFGIKGWLINTFSVNAGYNMVSSERIHADGKLMQKKSTEYQKVNGVYVPIRDAQDTYDYSRDFSLRVHDEEVFKDVLINNDVVPAETFTYKNLGLKNGDKFIDKILSKEYTYQNGNLTEVEKKSK
jgi:hypothetical protein